MAEIIERGNNTPFIDLHPTNTGGKRRFLGKDLPAWGGSDGIESKFRRCKQCGFILNIQRNPPGSGWGNIEQEIFPNTDFNGSTNFDNSGTAFDGNYDNMIGNAGCPLCGASEYE